MTTVIQQRAHFSRMLYSYPTSMSPHTDTAALIHLQREGNNGVKRDAASRRFLADQMAQWRPSEGNLLNVLFVISLRKLIVPLAYTRSFWLKKTNFSQWNLLLTKAEWPLSTLKHISHHFRTHLIMHVLPKFCYSVVFFSTKDTKQELLSILSYVWIFNLFS